MHTFEADQYAELDRLEAAAKDAVRRVPDRAWSGRVLVVAEGASAPGAALVRKGGSVFSGGAADGYAALVSKRKAVKGVPLVNGAGIDAVLVCQDGPSVAIKLGRVS